MGEPLLAGAIAGFAIAIPVQVLLVALGSTLHGRLPPAVQVVTQAIGGVVILGFAARILADAIAG